MKVVVNFDLCESNAVCMGIAPEVFEVRDAKSGDDLTRSILLQIILEEEANGQPMFSSAALSQIIRYYGHAMQGMMGKVIGLGLLTFVVQTTGYMSLMALLTDRDRPTVGTAIANAFKSLPSLIGAAIVAYIGLILIAVLAVSVVAGIYTASHSMGLAWILGLLVAALITWILTKLSLTLPVIVIDRVRNPVAALRRSWRLVSGNSLRVFVFYLLLGIGYTVVSMVFFIALAMLFGAGQMAAGAPQAGTGAMIALGLVSGVVGTAVSVLFTSIVAAIHRQLAGPSTAAYDETFA